MSALPYPPTDEPPAPVAEPLLDLTPEAMRLHVAERLVARATETLAAREAVTVREIAAALRAEIDALHGIAETMEGLSE